jgi:hypothetical protein
MREIIDIDVEIKSHEQTLKDLHQQVLGGDEIVGQFSVFACCFGVLKSLRATYWSFTKRKHGTSWTTIAKGLVGKGTRKVSPMSHSGSRSTWAS